MNESTEHGNTPFELGWLICIGGWTILGASIFFAWANKSADAEPPYAIPFWACFALLTGTSVFYLIARRRSERWRSRAVRSFFSPYLVGASIWLLLALLFIIVHKVAG